MAGRHIVVVLLGLGELARSFMGVPGPAVRSGAGQRMSKKTQGFERRISFLAAVPRDVGSAEELAEVIRSTAVEKKPLCVLFGEDSGAFAKLAGHYPRGEFVIAPAKADMSTYKIEIYLAGDRLGQFKSTDEAGAALEGLGLAREKLSEDASSPADQVKASFDKLRKDFEKLSKSLGKDEQKKEEEEPKKKSQWGFEDDDALDDDEEDPRLEVPEKKREERSYEYYPRNNKTTTPRRPFRKTRPKLEFKLPPDRQNRIDIDPYMEKYDETGNLLQEKPTELFKEPDFFELAMERKNFLEEKKIKDKRKYAHLDQVGWLQEIPYKPPGEMEWTKVDKMIVDKKEALAKFHEQQNNVSVIFDPYGDDRIFWQKQEEKIRQRMAQPQKPQPEPGAMPPRPEPRRGPWIPNFDDPGDDIIDPKYWPYEPPGPKPPPPKPKRPRRPIPKRYQ